MFHMGVIEMWHALLKMQFLIYVVVGSLEGAQELRLRVSIFHLKSGAKELYTN
jgi:hypothetical protein